MSGMPKVFAALAPLAALVFASLALASPIDWNAVAGENTVVILTREADGSPRETTVWMVVIDGQGYIRTGNTHWHENIVRDPKIGVRIAGTEYAVSAKHVEDPALKTKVNAAMNAKYGFSDTFIGWFANQDNAQIMALVPRDPAVSAP